MAVIATLDEVVTRDPCSGSTGRASSSRVDQQGITNPFLELRAFPAKACAAGGRFGLLRDFLGLTRAGPRKVLPVTKS